MHVISSTGLKLMKVIVVDGSIDKVKYHAIRAEFQVRGSPPHSSFVVGPECTSVMYDVYISFVDSGLKAYVPNPNENPELFKLVTTYQLHSHSKSC